MNKPVGRSPPNEQVAHKVKQLVTCRLVWLEVRAVDRVLGQDHDAAWVDMGSQSLRKKIVDLAAPAEGARWGNACAEVLHVAVPARFGG